MKEQVNVLADNLLCAMKKGKVWSCGGGMVMDADGGVIMSTTDMYHAVMELGKRGVSVQRVDAGGQPTWMLVK